ncbi:MAG: threonylcarbamoyl-AMP synthase [Ruminococcus sp.]|nr:threonylcarbamoyl-AMP synthase [Ruminococcus sp.]
MVTEILGADSASVRRAAELLSQGQVVAIPTETVYGLAANALDEAAVKRIFEAKGRPSDNPLIVHIADKAQLFDLASEVPEIALKCAERFMPGPLTMILPKADCVPDVTSGGLDTVGIRMPAHPAARAVINACGFALAAPSANLSGSPSPTSFRHVKDDMDGRVAAIVDGGDCSVGVESTVICFENGRIRILRPGFVCAEELSEIAETVIDKGVLEQLSADAVVRSPGMKYKHYAPKADVTVVEGDVKAFRDYVGKKLDTNTMLLVFSKEDCEGLDTKFVELGTTAEEQAQNLFTALRSLDEMGAQKVYSRCPEKSGVGLAVYNRLIRAAGFKAVKV